MIIDGLVTSIIPVYNRAALLREAVESVLSQTYRPIEILIVDDGSTDETGELAQRMAAGHPEIRVVHQSNRGPGVAREAGRQRASGEFIQYLDSDDLLMPRKFEMQVVGLRTHPECRVSYGKSRSYRLGETPADVPLRRTGERHRTLFPDFLVSRWWSTSTPLYHHEITDRIGPWEPLRNEEDWEYDCRVAAQGVLLHYCDEFVSDFRQHTQERMSRSGSTDPAKLKDRARAHGLIYQHARDAGIDHGFPEMQHFARELFLLCRQCGAAGLEEQARTLFELARSASGPDRARGWDFRLYELLTGCVGWSHLGKLVCASDRFRR